MFEENEKSKREILINDFVTMSQFTCEHQLAGHKPCDEVDADRGACCNACWARRCAQKWLKELGYSPSNEKS